MSRELRSRVAISTTTTQFNQTNVKLKQTSKVTTTPRRERSNKQKHTSDATKGDGEDSPTIVLQLEGILTCDVPNCNYQTSFKTDLERHAKTQHELKRLKCPHCGFDTHSEVAYIRHTSTHKSNLPFKCHLCSWAYPVLSLLTQHMKQIHERAERRKQGINRASEFGKRFKCSKCDFRAVCKQEIHLHNYSHETERKNKCSVPGCGYVSKTTYSLREHLKRHDAKAKKEFQCQLCSKLFWTRFALSCHIDSHTKERRHPCSKCKFAAIFPCNLRRHMNTHAKKSHRVMEKREVGKSLGVENNELSLETSGTENSRSSGSANILLNEATMPRLQAEAHDSPEVLKKRQKKSTKIPEKKLKCDHCDFRAINKSKITRHAVVHRDQNDKLYSCSFPGCDFKTNWEDYVIKHKRDFHKPTPDIVCPVEGCGFQTKWKDFFAKHKKIHATKRKRIHQCPMCRKAFYDSAGLKRHINIHTGENKYKCSLCDYVSGESSNFYAHRRKYHAGQECEPIKDML